MPGNRKVSTCGCGWWDTLNESISPGYGSSKISGNWTRIDLAEKVRLAIPELSVRIRTSAVIIVSPETSPRGGETRELNRRTADLEKIMTYPTMEQVESADQVQLCRWHRFLSSPGMGAIGKKDFAVVMEKEALVMVRIQERLKAAGGMTPAISKEIGWEK